VYSPGEFGLRQQWGDQITGKYLTEKPFAAALPALNPSPRLFFCIFSSLKPENLSRFTSFFDAYFQESLEICKR
jgi:hypothetical protein